MLHAGVSMGLQGLMTQEMIRTTFMQLDCSMARLWSLDGSAQRECRQASCNTFCCCHILQPMLPATAACVDLAAGKLCLNNLSVAADLINAGMQ